MSRRCALQTWDGALDALGQAFQQYSDSTVALFAQFDGDTTSTARDDLSAEDALLHIDSRLARIQQLEAELHDMRIAVQGLRNTSTKLSPVTLLPPEIITYIISIVDNEDRLFLEAKEARLDEEEFEDDEDDETPDPPHFPTLVSHVCRRWRQIALETPMFWTRIDFREGPPYDKAKEWLKRSQDCNIEVVFDSWDDGSDFKDDDDGAKNRSTAVSVVQPHVSRINRLLIRMSDIDEIAEVVDSLTDPSRPLPLKALALLADDDQGNLLAAEGLLAKAGTLKTILEGLEELSIDKVALPWDQVSFSGLRKLKLTTVSPTPSDAMTGQQLYTILKTSPDLETLSLFDDSLAISESDLSLPAITLPRLSSLSLLMSVPPVFQHILRILKCPNLVHCSLEEEASINQNSPTLNDDDRKHTLTFFDQINPDSLRSIKLIQDYMTSSALTEVLGNFRGIEELSFGSCEGVDGPFLEWLSGDISTACPNLKSLKFDSCEALTAQSLKKLVEARIDAGRPLQSIALDYCSLEPGIEEWLKERVPKVIMEEYSDGEGEDDELDAIEMELTTGDEFDEGTDADMTDDDGW